eukprot:TRINITY_DN2929_c0_g1_i1.p1 TRINITY_DN2929_c0_g1~~TRINITY_DN2929_c0_g1_i1.p1  ORF type:complete len:455 (-),score=104.94 TRINITY_DN2929_c0_g1_i1:93-1457(-)
MSDLIRSPSASYSSVSSDSFTSSQPPPSASPNYLNHLRSRAPFILYGSLYVLLSISLPHYSKYVLDEFPHPIEYTLLVIAVVLAVLTSYCIAKYLVRRYLLRHSVIGWSFDRNFFRKVRLISPIGLSFGMGLTLSNLGLASGPVILYVLLRASEVVWAALFSAALLFEIPSVPVVYAMAVLAVGCVFTTVEFGKPMIFTQALLANAASAMILGLQFVTTRAFWMIIREIPSENISLSGEEMLPTSQLDLTSKISDDEGDEDDEDLAEYDRMAAGGLRANSGTPMIGVRSIAVKDEDEIRAEMMGQMDFMEVTFFKVLIASVVIVVATLLSVTIDSVAWSHVTQRILLLACGGMVLTIGLHSTVIGLSSVTSATTIAVITQLPIFIQFIISIETSNSDGDMWIHWLGACLIIIGGALYAWYKIVLPVPKTVYSSPLVLVMQWLDRLSSRRRSPVI